MESPLEKIQGSVERVTFHNAENGYCVLRIKAKGERELVTVVGHLASVTAGESIEASGTWERHKEFGRQFKADALAAIQPSSLDAIEKYLASGMIRGVGEHFAQKMVRKFGDRIFDIIELHPDRLKEVSGLGRIRIHQITKSWKEQKVVREIILFLQAHGVSTEKAARIYKTYGKAAVELVKDNPYRLARDISGIGFKGADAIAMHLGIAKDSILRARAGLHHVLARHVGNGHCAYPMEELVVEAVTLLTIDQQTLEKALEMEVGEGFLIRDRIEGRVCVYPKVLFDQEERAAEWIAALAKGAPPWGDLDAEAALAEVSVKLGFTLDPLQRQAITDALRSKALVITGGPGTGKTTLTRALVTILRSRGVKIALCSPTGRAAKRLSECTGMEAKTIHRLLGVERMGADRTGGKFVHDSGNRLPIDFLLVDEASMIDLPLACDLLSAVPPKAAWIFVGDVDQIPSVGPGCILKNLIESRAVPTVRLTQIFRQSAESAIIAGAHQIQRGELPDLSPKGKDADFHFVESGDVETTITKIVDLVKTRIPRHLGVDPLRDVQVLSPMNRGPLGARELNVALQRAFNPDPPSSVDRFGTVFAVGDKVMVTQNDYDKEIFNGDIGYIQSLNLPDQETRIDFDGRSVLFEFSEMDILSLAYACTIHKAQGSEYPAIVMPIVSQHTVMLKRNLLYTGVTRGKRMVILIGQRQAIARAVGDFHQGKRWTKLADRIASKI